MNGTGLQNGMEELNGMDKIDLNNGLSSATSASSNVRSIWLPSNFISESVDFALDIGGSLAKIAHVTGYKEAKGKMYCLVRLVTYEGDNVDDWIAHIRTKILNSSRIYKLSKFTALSTGTGCLKYQDRICHAFPELTLYTDVHECDNTVNGIDLLWRNLPPDELLYKLGSDRENLKFATSLTSSGVLPCLVASMGSALTVVQVNENGIVEGIVGGSSQGGMSFLGLGCLLTSASSFQELMEMANKGNRQMVDLTVKDTAGMDYNMALCDMLVSSFGKVAKLRSKCPDVRFNEVDLAASLLHCVTEEMTKTVYLVAKAQNINTVLFCGTFFHNNTTVMKHVSEKIDICSTYLQHELRAFFLKHEGYLGALGLLKKNCSTQNGCI